MWNGLTQAYQDVIDFCAGWKADHLPWFTINQGGGEVEPNEPYYKLLSERKRPLPKFMRNETRLRFEFSNQKFNSFFEAEEKCSEFYERVFDQYVKPIDETSQVRMYIDHPLFDGPINLPLMLKSQLTPSVVYKYFYDTLQSKKKLGNLNITVLL
jgi:hypothetical protein